jgi:Ca2+-binding EF-hand superfamily protein
MQSLDLDPSEEEIDRWVREIDIDGNGTVDFSEFLTMMTTKLREQEEERIKLAKEAGEDPDEDTSTSEDEDNLYDSLFTDDTSIVCV